jgi:hypothetical protein
VAVVYALAVVMVVLLVGSGIRSWATWTSDSRRRRQFERGQHRS